MAVQRTNTCRSHGHPEFQIAYDQALIPVEDDVHWFIGWLENSVAQGKRITPGQTCQVGWIVTEVRLGESGSLSLWEPDMRQVPVVWTESVTNTLAHLRLQKDVVESVLSASDLSFPSMLQSSIVCARLGQTEGLVLERTKPSESDSGWFCGCRGGNHDHNNAGELRRVSLYEAAVRYAPQIVPYLALPAGVLIGISGGAPKVFQDGKPLVFKPESFLAARHSGR